MNSMIKPIFEPSRNSSTNEESRTTDSASVPGRPAATSIGNSFTVTSGKPYSKEFAAFMRRLDGLRIPPSPLHDL